MSKRYDKPLTQEQLAVVKDADIDCFNIPPLSEDFWKKAQLRWPTRRKKQPTMRLDADMVDWIKSQGKGYQTRMNAVLRSSYESQRNSEI